MQYVIESRDLDEVDTAVEFATLPTAEIGGWIGPVFGEIAQYLGRKGAGPVGPPFARYTPAADGSFDIEAGFVASTPVGGEGEIEPSDLPAGTAAVTVHVGAYDAIAPAYTALTEWILAAGGEPAGSPWEVYLDDPATPEDRRRTEIVMPYRIP